MFLSYAALVSVFSCFHEVWRDEVVPVSLAIQSRSLTDLFHNIKDYGHPSVWFVILWCAYHILPQYKVLKIVNLSINITAAYVFLKRAPFSLIEKVLFLLGYFPFYYLPVVNRSYGLCWLLFLLFCILYPQRWRMILPLSAVLFIFSNTHAAGIIISAAVLLVLCGELVFTSKEALKESSWLKVISGLLMIAAGIGLSVWQVAPDSSSDIFSRHSLSLPKVMDAALQGLFLPGGIFRHILGEEHIKAVTGVIMGCYLLLFGQWAALAVMILSMVGLSMFFQLVYPQYDLYHESFAYMLMIFAFWLSRPAGVRKLFFILVLLLQIMMAYPVLTKEFSSDFSSSRHFAQWINAQPSGQKYILMGEPDYLLESMPYYVSNRIYISREHAFGQMTHDTLKNQAALSLEDFLNAGEALKAQGQDVWLVVGHNLSREGPFQIHFSYGKLFTYTPDSLALWEQKTRKVAGFHGAFFTDENYDVYVLK